MIFHHYRNNQLTLKDNLEQILGEPFPRKEAAILTEKNWTIPCGICYSQQLLDELIPEKVCENKGCSQIFHKACLIDVSAHRAKSSIAGLRIPSNLIIVVHVFTGFTAKF